VEGPGVVILPCSISNNTPERFKAKLQQNELVVFADDECFVPHGRCSEFFLVSFEEENVCSDINPIDVDSQAQIYAH